jgi:GntR family galactonate operon transcriptional repressor
MRIGSVVRRTLPLQVPERIGRAIVAGRLASGAGIPSEIQLTRELGVSRTVVREGLKLLADKGLISSRPKSGTVVLPPSGWNTLDVDILGWRLGTNPSAELVNHWFDFRRQFEPYASRLATERADEVTIEKIAEAGRQFACEHDDVAELIEADIRLHQVILEASRNPFFVPLGRTLESALRASFQLSTHRLGARQGAVPLHQEVVDAIVDRDPVAAETAMLRLIEVSREDLLWVLTHRRRRGLAVAPVRPRKRGRSAPRRLAVAGEHVEP